MNAHAALTGLSRISSPIFITSGIGEKYPVGIPVGKVVEVNNFPYEPFQIIRLQPIQNMNSLDYILIGGKTNAN